MTEQEHVTDQQIIDLADAIEATGETGDYRAAVDIVRVVIAAGWAPKSDHVTEATALRKQVRG